VFADEPAADAWNYSPELLRPFWLEDTVHGESVLFIIKDERTKKASASALYPIDKVLAVRNSAGNVIYKEGRDYIWKKGSREIVLPAGSRIVSRSPKELRRPAGTQKYALTHRDGNGEIFFAAGLEYAELQTCITYQHAPCEWKTPLPKFDAAALPRTVQRLKSKEPLAIVVLGDSISTGLNASAVGKGAPFQPGYPELVRRHLAETHKSEVTLSNLSVGGTDTKWGLTQIDKVAEARPHLVILAFGMNDSAGRSADEYQANTQAMIAKIREKLPDAEFILVATMLGNPNWTRLRHELFPQYRDSLARLAEPGVALADMTSIWSGFHALKQDWDQTGNGVNHPNDFGHRVYAQSITALLIP
jgi:acyl-CoA thioesterase-1